MSKRGNGYGSENRVNILKKVKVGKNWNLYLAVIEGYYYIEWWQNGRKREQIKDRVEALDRARRKAIELQANRAGIEVGSGRGPTVAERLPRIRKTWSLHSVSRKPTPPTNTAWSFSRTIAPSVPFKM
jgi:hypothetical protein